MWSGGLPLAARIRYQGDMRFLPLMLLLPACAGAVVFQTVTTEIDDAPPIRISDLRVHVLVWPLIAEIRMNDAIVTEYQRQVTGDLPLHP